MTDQFAGFEIPRSNYSKLPHALIDALPNITSLAEMKVILYIIRHTWGYHDTEKRITLDEFQHGRKRRDGTRLDGGTGMSKPSIISGIKKAVEHGFILVETDDSDKGRVKKLYQLNVTDCNSGVKEVYPTSNESLHRTEKDTEERNLFIPAPQEDAPGSETLPPTLDGETQPIDERPCKGKHDCHQASLVCDPCSFTDMPDPDPGLGPFANKNDPNAPTPTPLHERPQAPESPQAPIVVNFRDVKDHWDKTTLTWDDPRYVYIGRAHARYMMKVSKWRNPHKIDVEEGIDRAEAIRLYREHIQSSKRHLSELHELTGKILVCWCKPEPCHGDVLVELWHEHVGGKPPQAPDTELVDRNCVHCGKSIKVRADWKTPECPNCWTESYAKPIPVEAQPDTELVEWEDDGIDYTEAPGSLPSWWTKQHTAIIADVMVNGKAPLRNNAIRNWSVMTLHLVRQGYLEQKGTSVVLTEKGRRLNGEQFYIPEILEAVESRIQGKAKHEADKAKPKPKKKAKRGGSPDGYTPEQRPFIEAIMRIWMDKPLAEFAGLLPSWQKNLRRVAGLLRDGGYTTENVEMYFYEYLPAMGKEKQSTYTYNAMVGAGQNIEAAMKWKASQQQRKPEVLLDPSTFEAQS